MIPSDHFVRFYNEVFKFLDERNGLQDYYQEISHHQELHCFKLFWEKGIEGMREYWDGIRIEENCVFKPDTNMDKDMRCGGQLICPSLSKVLDSDAEPCKKYCCHCPGWVQPLLTKCGFYSVYDIMDPMKPECNSCITEFKEKAEAWRDKILAEGADSAHIYSNLDQWETVEKNRARRHADAEARAARK